MKIGLIADVHPNLYGTEAVLAKLRDCSVVICAGDLTGYFNYVNETIQLVRRHRALCVRGNHDQFLFDSSSLVQPKLARSVAFTRHTITPENLAFLHELPYQLVLFLDDLKILVCHGSPWDLLDGYVYPDRGSFDDFMTVHADVVVLGHTHWPMVKRVGNKLIIIPGSCGQPRNGSAAASCAVLDTQTLQVEFREVSFDMETACQEALRAGLCFPYRRPFSSGRTKGSHQDCVNDRIQDSGGRAVR